MRQFGFLRDPPQSEWVIFGFREIYVIIIHIYTNKNAPMMSEAQIPTVLTGDGFGE
jgi:hypothetical protein